uniref:DUF104 domain-containing protein n=1 Tax=Candidatus Kentrum sp. UNK TaxID=2126344 RepID=A0A451AFE4_9GAMM|nr:MAG: hypothetical protein BECKUNK1418G_GA0071005_104923 [Candidatus Kentron sp. UNK]VFK71179.1 MAG: hypothetical protein BECKUNK1418H_GA0071006_105323 [Candidatus Kentron sp. UNK]
MAQTLYATYDGHVFMPEKNLDLLPNRRYSIRIEVQPEQKPEPRKRILQKLSERAMDLGVSDLAAQHDDYLYGTGPGSLQNHATGDWRQFVGVLKDSPNLRGDPVTIAREMRNEWD